MILSVGIILLLGLIIGRLGRKVKLPDLVAMLIVGIIIGPYGLNIINPKLLKISSELRKLALVIILLRAGLGLNAQELKNIGIPALKMSCIPGVFEGLAIAFLASNLLNISFIEGGILGFIIAAVSPAVVVPAMLKLMQREEKREIGTLILAAASIDDVFAITICNIFISLYFSRSTSILLEIMNIPISILLGILLAYIFSRFLRFIFKYFKSSVERIILILGMALVLVGMEELLKVYINIASLIGVMALGFFVNNKLAREEKLELSRAYNEIWSVFQILLFVLIGMELDIKLVGQYGYLAILIIVFGLVFRSLGVLISLIGRDFSRREKIFIIASYIPKATVQGAMAGVPLAMGVESGDMILSIGILSIILTAPLGAYWIEALSEQI